MSILQNLTKKYQVKTTGSVQALGVTWSMRSESVEGYGWAVTKSQGSPFMLKLAQFSACVATLDGQPADREEVFSTLSGLERDAVDQVIRSWVIQSIFQDKYIGALEELAKGVGVENEHVQTLAALLQIDLLDLA